MIFEVFAGTKHSDLMTYPFKFVLYFYFFILPLLALPAAVPAADITIVGDEWCPYNCQPGAEFEGLGVEIARLVFEPEGYQVQYLTLNSWAEAIERTRKGEFDAIIGAYRSDAPDFIFPRQNFAYTSHCFYTLQDSDWIYHSTADLEQVSLGVINGYSYGKVIDEYVKSNPARVKITDGNDALEQLISYLVNGDIEVLIEDYRVMSYTLASSPHKERLKKAECSPSIWVYIAFSPHQSRIESSKKLAKLFDDRFKKLLNTNQLRYILEKDYGMIGSLK